MKNKKKSKIFCIAITGMFAAAALALSFAERLILSVVPLPMGVKPGLSNIIVMFACFSLGLAPALGIAAIKSGFNAFLSGGLSGFMSLCGGLLSVLSMHVSLKFFRGKLSYTGISVISSVIHNMGQLLAASAAAGSSLFLPYAPVLLVSGVAFGIVTGIILTYTFPYLERMKFFNDV